ncbi:MAG: hypothetical protein EXR57_02560 [Dehalococcoidia bacterium]|nr:hypothetical protein [Dehalococcoidia bacterium]MSQ34684.1 hypothetical protein [Dehalococcoidia bacterium]
MKPLALPYHHGEPSDPTLIEWVMDKLHSLISFSPFTMVVILGAAIIAVPLIFTVMAVRRRSRKPKIRVE